MIKGKILGENITIVTVYTPNIGAQQYVRPTPTDIKKVIDSNTKIVGDFLTLHSDQQRDQQNRKLIRKHKS